MNNLALSYLLKKTFNKYPLDHSLNPNKIEKIKENFMQIVKNDCKQQDISS